MLVRSRFVRFLRSPISTRYASFIRLSRLKIGSFIQFHRFSYFSLSVGRFIYYLPIRRHVVRNGVRFFSRLHRVNFTRTCIFSFFFQISRVKRK